MALFTIIPTPVDSKVVLTADGYTQISNSITVERGTLVIYNVSKEGYITQSGSIIVEEDTVLDISKQIIRSFKHIL